MKYLLPVALLGSLISVSTVQASQTEEFYNAKPVQTQPKSFVMSLQEIVESAEFKKVWKDFTEVCKEALGLTGQRSEKSIIDTLAQRDPKYVRLVREAQEILVGTDSVEYFRKIEELMAQQKQLKKRIIELKNERISAPTSSLNPFVKTVADIDEQIKVKIPEQLAQTDLMIQSYKDSLHDSLVNKDIAIEADQLDYFIVSAEGDDLIDLMTMAGNMKTMQYVMGEQLKGENSANTDLAKNYAGMHMISLESYAMAHEHVISKLADYSQKLEGYETEAQKSLKEARQLLKSAGQDPNEVSSLKANVRINEETLRAAGTYKQILKRRTESLQKNLEVVNRKIKVARNTYDTISNGAALISLISKSSDEYAMVINFKMPELENLYEPAMKEAFASISDKLRD